MKKFGFCDLNISIPSHQFKEKCLEELVSLGYKTVALNTTVYEEKNETSKKKKSQNKEVIPPPQATLDSEEVQGKLQILQRITLHFSDANQLQKLTKSENTKKYDIVSVVPKSFTAFQLACACKDIDLISFDASEHPIFMNRKTYNLAVANSIYFEVPYAPAIADSGKRRTTIQVAHAYHTYGKSKNIILSSGITDFLKLRSPYDVANLYPFITSTMGHSTPFWFTVLSCFMPLALLFGLSEEQAKNSMLDTCRALILRAEGRRFSRTAMTMMITDLDLDSDGEPMAKRYKTTEDSDSDMS
ncbi:Ribonuclease P protein subunit p30 [Homalodisca vitripennis]|nr:Ribonuclease P protein subunit p30 [Homalodisca vitripennis]